MSLTKNSTAAELEKRLVIENYMLKEGKLNKCPVHELLYGSDFRPDPDFLKKTLKIYEKGPDGPLSGVSALEERDFVDLLHSVFEEHNVPRCPLCSK